MAHAPSPSVSREGFLKVLDDLSSTATGFRKSAFQKAKASLAGYKSSTLTYDQAQSLPGFGKGIMERFVEYQLTAHLEELKGVDELRTALELFEGVYGVGPVLAKKWFDSGYRKLSDVPQESLTRSQALGIKYYQDINSRIPRAEIVEIDKLLQTIVKTFNSVNKLNVRAKICGSYLRGRKDSGDIDVIISEAQDHPFIDAFLRSGLVSHVLAKGASKVLTLGGLGTHQRRIDFELVRHENWVYALTYFTGSKNFNQHMRGIAKDQGMLLNHEGLFVGTSAGAKVYFETEEELFDFLGMKFLTPAERDKF